MAGRAGTQPGRPRGIIMESVAVIGETRIILIVTATTEAIKKKSDNNSPPLTRSNFEMTNKV